MSFLPAAPSRLVLVDDHAIVRRGLKQLFDREEDFDVVGEASSEADAFDLVEELVPDLLVTDLTLDGRNGLDLIARVKRYHPDVPILVLSMHEETLYAKRVIAAGAQGYVMKRNAEGELLRAARLVRDGGRFLSAEVADGDSTEGPATPESSLTDRELEVLTLLGKGFAPRHIAERLFISVSTVEVHRQRIREKLGIESSAVLLRYAVKWAHDKDAV